MNFIWWSHGVHINEVRLYNIIRERECVYLTFLPFSTLYPPSLSSWGLVWCSPSSTSTDSTPVGHTHISGGGIQTSSVTSLTLSVVLAPLGWRQGWSWQLWQPTTPSESLSLSEETPGRDTSLRQTSRIWEMYVHINSEAVKAKLHTHMGVYGV